MSTGSSKVTRKQLMTSYSLLILSQRWWRWLMTANSREISTRKCAVRQIIQVSLMPANRAKSHGSYKEAMLAMISEGYLKVSTSYRRSRVGLEAILAIFSKQLGSLNYRWTVTVSSQLQLGLATRMESLILKRLSFALVNLRILLLDLILHNLSQFGHLRKSVVPYTLRTLTLYLTLRRKIKPLPTYFMSSID